MDYQLRELHEREIPDTGTLTDLVNWAGWRKQDVNVAALSEHTAVEGLPNGERVRSRMRIDSFASAGALTRAYMAEQLPAGDYQLAVYMATDAGAASRSDPPRGAISIQQGTATPQSSDAALTSYRVSYTRLELDVRIGVEGALISIGCTGRPDDVFYVAAAELRPKFIEELATQTQNQIGRVDALANQTRDDLQTVKDSIGALGGRVDGLQTSLETATNGIQNLQDELNRVETKGDTAVTTINQSLQELRDKDGAQDITIASNTSAATTAQNAATTALTQAAAAKDAADTAQTTANQAQQLANIAQQAADSLRTDVDKNEDAIAGLRRDHDRDISSLKTKDAAQDNLIGQNTTDLTSLKNTVNTEFPALRGEFNNLDQEVKANANGLRGLRRDHDRLKTEVDSLEGEVDKNRRDVLTATTNITILQGQVAQNTTNVNKATTDLSALTSKHTQDLDDVNDKLRELDTLAKGNQEADQTLRDDLNKHLQAADDRQDKLEEQVAVLVGKVSLLEAGGGGTGTGSSEAITKIQTQIQTIIMRLDSLDSGGATHDHNTIIQRLDDLQTGLNGLRDSVNGRLDVLEGYHRNPGDKPEIQVSLDPIAFPNTAIKETSTVPITLSNTGKGTLTVTPSLTGEDASQFQITPAASINIAPEAGAVRASQVIQIRFSPTTLGLKRAQLKLVTNDPDEAELLIDLSGTATAEVDRPGQPDIHVSSRQVFFPNTVVGERSIATFTITNEGKKTLELGDPVPGLTLGNFEITSAWPKTISPGASVTVTVSHRPSAVAGNTVSLTFSVNDPLEKDGLVTIRLYGAAIESSGQRPAIEVSDATLAFGDVKIGESKRLTGTVKNRGNAGVWIALDDTEDDFNAVTQLHENDSTNDPHTFYLAPGSEMIVVFTFAPSAEGLASASMKTLSPGNSELAMPVFNLSGTGTAGVAEPELTAEPSMLTWGYALNTEPEKKVVTISNSSTVSATVSVGPQHVGTGSHFEFSPSDPRQTVPAGGSLTLTVWPKASAAGTFLSALLVTPDTGEPLLVELKAEIEEAAEPNRYFVFQPDNIDFGRWFVGEEAPTRKVKAYVSYTGRVEVEDIIESGDTDVFKRSGLGKYGYRYPQPGSPSGTGTITIDPATDERGEKSVVYQYVVDKDKEKPIYLRARISIMDPPALELFDDIKLGLVPQPSRPLPVPFIVRNTGPIAQRWIGEVLNLVNCAQQPNDFAFPEAKPWSDTVGRVGIVPATRGTFGPFSFTVKVKDATMMVSGEWTNKFSKRLVPAQENILLRYRYDERNDWYYAYSQAGVINVGVTQSYPFFGFEGGYAANLSIRTYSNYYYAGSVPTSSASAKGIYKYTVNLNAHCCVCFPILLQSRGRPDAATVPTHLVIDYRDGEPLRIPIQVKPQGS